jgi:penicillin-binding protein A
MFYRPSTENPAQRLRRARPVIAMAGVAFAIGAIVGANHSTSSSHELAARFVEAWTRGDYATMYSDIDASSRRTTSIAEFADVYRKALTTATATSLRAAGRPHDVPGGLVAVPVRVRTRLFGTLSLGFQLKVDEGGGEGTRIGWSRSLAFPGLRPGELLGRRTVLPRRATLLARDGSILAESPEAGAAGADRSSPLGALASAVLGTVGPIPAARRQALEAEGAPATAIVGVSGLERALDDRLRGIPGGELLAGPRVLASVAPHPAPAVHSTVSTAVQRSAVTALGGQLGGIVAMQPSTGQILAVAGIGLDSLQPPGSTFKMVTLTGVLAAGIANPHSVFGYATFATLDGVKLNNANGENCGGSLELAWCPPRNASDSTRTRGSPAQHRARCPRPRRSRVNSTSARRPSARVRSWRARFRWPSSPRPSPTAGGGPGRPSRSERRPRRGCP